MNAGAINANVWGMGEVDPVVEARESQIRAVKPRSTWDRERFAREQIRGLVRQVFTMQKPCPVRQVVFSAIEARTDVRSVCMRVGEALASEARGSVAIVGSHSRSVEVQSTGSEAEHLRKNAFVLGNGLCLLPAKDCSGHDYGASSVHAYMGEIRKEFEYSVVEGRPCGECDEALEMAQFADGIVLVISAEHTRRVMARKAVERLHEAQVRILGTVLSDREFPMPERLYHWL